MNDIHDWDRLCPPAFKAYITIFDRRPNAPVKWNGVRWSFVFADDLDAHPKLPAVSSNTWPLFRNSDGSVIPRGVELKGQLRATMHIVFPESVKWFKQKGLTTGTRFYCCEGSRAYAEGRVTEILDPELL